MASSSLAAAELIYVDGSGVMRWQADQREVALFGANYCLPSSSDYRAAGYVGADRKKLVERDLTHFARMGWDGLRLALWGDWENCDKAGNLIANDHLDLLDYVIFQARQRGIFLLFTPIQRYSALWPDGKDTEAVQGFSKFFPPAELGTNPAAIAAQQNFLRQILDHVNPYTHVALKDEPAILFIELINEPDHHADDFAGSVAYINALAEAVRSTGCQKILFHNLSQDFAMAPAIAASKAQGFSLGWYPTGLLAGRTLTENYLRWADAYAPLLNPEIPRLPRIVYEFDSADMVSGYMYPAMVRSFREVGAQFATMFAYDMLDTAPYNLGWQTHYLNLVYSPRKAISAVIAAEAMRTLPRDAHYGRYPENLHFGPFRVSYEEDLSEMLTAEKFLYANDTNTRPPNPATLRQIVGEGSSAVVAYEGIGSYFLDKIDDGRWRLEVYPDAVFVQDPFAQRLNYRTVSARLISRLWSMRVALPDLGSDFSVAPLNAGNTYKARSADGEFQIRPGVYLLSRQGIAAAPLPEQVGQLKFGEFVCPPDTDLPTQVVPHLHGEYLAGAEMDVAMDVITRTLPQSVLLHVRNSGGDTSHTYPMLRQRDYRYRARIPSDGLHEGAVEFSLSVETAENTIELPGARAAAFQSRIVPLRAPLILVDPARDRPRLFATRLSEKQHELPLKLVAPSGAEPAYLRVQWRETQPMKPYVLSLPIKARIVDRGAAIRDAKALRLTVRGGGTHVRVQLVESDGTTWAAAVPLQPGWDHVVLPLTDLRVETGSKLPMGYPGTWNSELPPPAGREGKSDAPILDHLEHVQLSVRRLAPDSPTKDVFADIASVELLFE